MTWVRIDDGMPDHPKFACPDDENDAMALWVRAICYAAKRKTGAFVPTSELNFLSRTDRGAQIAEDLVLAKLWVPHPGGFRISGGSEFWSVYSDGYWCKSEYKCVFARDLNKCRYCRSTEELTIDHVIPRCHGGGDGAGNLVVACWKCNQKKRGRTPDQAKMVLLPVPGDQ